MTDYDSRPDTEAHIRRVAELLQECCAEFERRMSVHDASKLQEPEKSAFDVATPKLKDLTYGSDDYRVALAELQDALDHHYANNSHHPEHFADGIKGMDLFDLLEMVVDWKAASERHADGNLYRSLLHNRKRFKISPQLFAILMNTARSMGWVV